MIVHKIVICPFPTIISGLEGHNGNSLHFSTAEV